MRDYRSTITTVIIDFFDFATFGSFFVRVITEGPHLSDDNGRPGSVRNDPNFRFARKNNGAPAWTRHGFA